MWSPRTGQVSQRTGQQIYRLPVSSSSSKDRLANTGLSTEVSEDTQWLIQTLDVKLVGGESLQKQQLLQCFGVTVGAVTTEQTIVYWEEDEAAGCCRETAALLEFEHRNTHSFSGSTCFWCTFLKPFHLFVPITRSSRYCPTVSCFTTMFKTVPHNTATEPQQRRNTLRSITFTEQQKGCKSDQFIYLFFTSQWINFVYVLQMDSQSESIKIGWSVVRGQLCFHASKLFLEEKAFSHSGQPDNLKALLFFHLISHSFINLCFTRINTSDLFQQIPD